MSVIGLDLGNDTSVIAAVKHRGIDVLLNDESNRETPSLVSFSDKQRFIGAAAAASMNPRSTISHLKRLVGRTFRDASRDLHLLQFPATESPDGGILITLPELNRSFTPVQILAMLLSHLKQIADRDLKTPVRDCVIGIPSYFTDRQRRAYLDAAAIAGLNPLRLMHDNAATALGYGLYRSDSRSAIIVVFVDIGHCDTQVSVVNFMPNGMRVLSHSSDPNLGGRDFDEVLFNYFCKKFNEQYKIDVSTNSRGSMRLRLACEKLKKVLSANAEAPISIECLMDEKDVKGFIKREEFESLSLGLLERVVMPCKKALEEAGLGKSQIHSVELVGSGSRIPAIARILSGFFKRGPSRTLNASECVARGCALQGAMLSPTCRVKDYQVQENFPFTVRFSSNEGLSSSILFQKGQQRFPSVRELTLNRSSPFHFEIFYADQSELPPGAASEICSYMVGPSQVPQGEKSQVKVRLCLNLHGIISLESASLIEDCLNDPLSRDTSRQGMGRVESESTSDAQPDTRATNVVNGSSAQSDSDSPSVDRSRKEIPYRQHEIRFNEIICGGMSKVGRSRKEIPYRQHEIPFHEIICGGMSKAELLEAQKEEQQLANEDKLMERTKDRRNSLESYVYEIRNKLSDRYRSFASESEKDGISTSLQKTEEWLYEDGDDETEMVYISKMEELQKLFDPIESRFKDEEARTQATRDLSHYITHYRKVAQSVPTAKRDAIINECKKAELWWQKKSQQQNSIPKNTDPILWSHEIWKTIEALDIYCRDVLRYGSSPSRAEDSEDIMEAD